MAPGFQERNTRIIGGKMKAKLSSSHSVATMLIVLALCGLTCARPTYGQNCAAVLYGDTGRVSAYGYGAGWSAATVDDAINMAHAEMDKKGIGYGDPHKYQGVVFKGCGVPHGAVAGVRDDQIPNDQDIVVVTLAFGKGASQSEAESNALASCRQLQNSSGKTCEVLQSW
jgi:hypothetical protein